LLCSPHGKPHPVNSRSSEPPPFQNSICQHFPEQTIVVEVDYREAGIQCNGINEQSWSQPPVANIWFRPTGCTLPQNKSDHSFYFLNIRWSALQLLTKLINAKAPLPKERFRKLAPGLFEMKAVALFDLFGEISLWKIVDNLIGEFLVQGKASGLRSTSPQENNIRLHGRNGNTAHRASAIRRPYCVCTPRQGVDDCPADTLDTAENGTAGPQRVETASQDSICATIRLRIEGQKKGEGSAGDRLQVAR